MKKRKFSRSKKNKRNREKSRKRSYRIGKGKPPKRTRWKPGQSGNPLGRPALPSEIRDLIGQDAPAIVRAVARKALRGDVRAAECLLKRHTPTLIAAEVSGSMDHTIAGLSKTQLQKLLKGLKD